MHRPRINIPYLYSLANDVRFINLLWFSRCKLCAYRSVHVCVRINICKHVQVHICLFSIIHATFFFFFFFYLYISKCESRNISSNKKKRKKLFTCATNSHKMINYLITTFLCLLQQGWIPCEIHCCSHFNNKSRAMFAIFDWLVCSLQVTSRMFSGS